MKADLERHGMPTLVGCLGGLWAEMYRRNYSSDDKSICNTHPETLPTLSDQAENLKKPQTCRACVATDTPDEYQRGRRKRAQGPDSQ